MQCRDDGDLFWFPAVWYRWGTAAASLLPGVRRFIRSAIQGRPSRRGPVVVDEHLCDRRPPQLRGFASSSRALQRVAFSSRGQRFASAISVQLSRPAPSRSVTQHPALRAPCSSVLRLSAPAVRVLREQAASSQKNRTLSDFRFVFHFSLSHHLRPPP